MARAFPTRVSSSGAVGEGDCPRRPPKYSVVVMVVGRTDASARAATGTIVEIDGLLRVGETHVPTTRLFERIAVEDSREHLLQASFYLVVVNRARQ